MKPRLLPLAAAVAFATVPLLLPSCTTITGEQTTTAHASYGMPGGTVTRTTEINATVTAIDPAQRKVSLVTRAGEKVTVKAGPEVVNFPQIRVGDQLKVSYTEELVVRMAKPDEKVAETGHVTGGASPLGAKPGVAVSQTKQTTATVTAIDAKRRKVTLKFSDGSSRKYPVRDDIDLKEHRVGDRVVIRSTEAFAVKMSKP